MRRKKPLILLIYLVFGLYLINLSIKFMTLPTFFLKINEIVFLISGILLVIAGILSLQNRGYYRRGLI